MCVCTISCLLAAAKSCNLQFDSNPQHMVEAGKFKLPWFDLFDDLVKEHICICLTTKKALSSWWSYTLKRRDKRGDSVHLAVDVQYLDLVSGLVIIWKQNLKIRTYITSENEYKKIKVATCHRLSIFLKFSINYLYHPDTAPTHASHLIWSHINKRLNVTWVTFEFRLLYLVHKYSTFNIQHRYLLLVTEACLDINVDTQRWCPGYQVHRCTVYLWAMPWPVLAHWQLTCPCQLSVQQCSAHNTHPGTCQPIWVVGGSTTKAASV